ncbi:MAG TPA: hypothetical protein VFA34_02835 [Actinomycetota bacterium]|jgi:hypothetical protein|nr:hypothetical protein [Actinomycetota bacterium]
MQHTLERFVSAGKQYLGTAAGKRKAVIAAAVAGVIFVTGSGAFAMRAASHQFANATIEKLGGDNPQAVLDAIADRVVKQLMSGDGPLAAAGKNLTDSFDTQSLINSVSSEVVSAGMGKLNGISTEAIVKQVTDALIAKAKAKIDALDVQGLARSTLDGAVQQLLDGVDLERIIKEELAKIDVEALVTKVVKEQMGSGPGGLLGMLIGR